MEKKEKEGEEGKKRKKEGGKGEEGMWASGGQMGVLKWMRAGGFLSPRI